MAKRKIPKRKSAKQCTKNTKLTKKQKKAQMLGTVFILILAAMVFILILMYGYRAINSFLEKQEQVALIEFQTELTSAVKEITLDFGSVKKLELRLGKGFDEVCFVTDPSITHEGERFEEAHPLLFDAYQGGNQNVFLLPITESSIYLENIEVKRGWFCMPAASGRITLRLEGLGNKAQISEWPTS